MGSSSDTVVYVRTYVGLNLSTTPHMHSFRHDDRPIDSSCGCEACRNYSRSYIHHLLKVRKKRVGVLG